MKHHTGHAAYCAAELRMIDQEASEGPMSVSLRPEFPSRPSRQCGGPAAPSSPLAQDGAAPLAKLIEAVRRNPPRIPVSGVNEQDVEATKQRVSLLTDLLKSAVKEDVRIYAQGIAALIRNHNENAPIGRTVRDTSFVGALYTAFDDFEKGLTDLNSDLMYDIERALEE